MEISSFIVMDILERAKELEAKGIDVVHMEVGEPDFPTPERVMRREEMPSARRSPSTPRALEFHSSKRRSRGTTTRFTG